MIQKVKIKKQVKSKSYLKFLSSKQKKQLLALARDLQDKKIIHINATAVGGGVAELMKSFILYFRSLGLNIDWYVIEPKAGKRFFTFTNRLHNALQGLPIRFTTKDWAHYKKVNKKIAADLSKLNYDIIVVHDPQPLYIYEFLVDRKPKILISHIDTSAAYHKAWKEIFSVMKKYDRIVFSNKDFVHGNLPKDKVRIFTPAIDPLSLKQKIVSPKKARKFLRHYGIATTGPLIVQVSRFDVWKNPLGVVNAFRSVQSSYPDAQLVLVGFREAKDNPQANRVYQDVAAIAGNDKNIWLFYDPKVIGGVQNITTFTMAAQNAADIIVQNSIKEGFGLIVSEAMWKGKAIIGGPASGIRKQIINGKNGFITKTPEELAKRIIYLLQHPKKRKQLGQAARKTVIKHFLFPRLVLDHLKLYRSVIKK